MVVTYPKCLATTPEKEKKRTNERKKHKKVDDVGTM